MEKEVGVGLEEGLGQETFRPQPAWTSNEDFMQSIQATSSPRWHHSRSYHADCSVQLACQVSIELIFSRCMRSDASTSRPLAFFSPVVSSSISLLVAVR